ncbi:MAG TPA: hypothetical protein VNO70_20370 [Blastocatellia bacterium]|nr:hypothetical protein [Blastocatellia bacterium]
MRKPRKVCQIVITTILTLIFLAGAACRGGNDFTRQPPLAANGNSSTATNAANTNRSVAGGNASEPGDTSPADFAGTAGITEKKKGDIGLVVLRDVRIASHGRFDRVVFEFAGDTVPGYHVEYIDRPVRACGSGNVVPVAGDGWLRVRLTPAQAHTEQGEATVKDRERRPQLSVLKEVKLICDFEADVEWVLGLSSPNRYRVLELASPPRLVIDIKHE